MSLLAAQEIAPSAGPQSGAGSQVLGACNPDIPVMLILVSAVGDQKRFRGGVVFESQRLCVSLNSRLGSNGVEKRRDQRLRAGSWRADGFS